MEEYKYKKYNNPDGEYPHMEKPYIIRVLIAFDQLLNAIVGRSPDRTLSSTIGERIESGTANKLEKVICYVLNKIQKDHCKRAIGK